MNIEQVRENRRRAIQECTNNVLYNVAGRQTRNPVHFVFRLNFLHTQHTSDDEVRCMLCLQKPIIPRLNSIIFQVKTNTDYASFSIFSFE